MRLTINGKSDKKQSIHRRRGMTLIEAVFSLLFVTLVSVTIVASMQIAANQLESTRNYTTLRTYAVNKIETLHMALEEGHEIDEENYNDNGEESGVHANVDVTELNKAFDDESLYLVKIKLSIIRGKEGITTVALLRKGCMAYDS